MGTLHKHQLCRLFQAAEVFSIMSTSETQNMALMQAMACGLPALGADSKALPEYIKPQAGFLIPPGDSAVLAEKLLLLLENPDLYQQLSAGALSFVEQFSAPAIARQWLQLYSQVIAQTRPATGLTAPEPK